MTAENSDKTALEDTEPDTKYIPPETDARHRFIKGNRGGGRPKGKGKGQGDSYRELIPQVVRRIVKIIAERDDDWLREMKKTHPDKLLVWSTQVLRVAAQLDQAAVATVPSVSVQIQSMDAEQVDSRIQTIAASLEKDNPRYYETNSDLSSTVAAQAVRIAQLEDELETLKGKPEVVVIEEAKPKILPAPESKDDTDARQKRLDRLAKNDQRKVDADEDEQDAIAHDKEFRRLLDLPTGEEGVWQ